MKFLKWLGIILLIIALSLWGTKIYLKDKYKDAVLNYVLDEVSHIISSRIDVGDFDFEVFKKFPYATIIFENIYVDGAEVPGLPADTLFQFEKIYFHINVLDILKENFVIQKLGFEHGIVNIQTNKAGQSNLEIFRNINTEESEHATDFILGLDEVDVVDVILNYQDRKNSVHLNLNSSESAFSGMFFSENFSLDLNLKGFCEKLQFEELEYIIHKELHLKGALAVSETYNKYQVSKGSITLDRAINFKTSGWVTKSEINLLMNAESFALEKLFELLPEPFKEYTNLYKAKGSASLNASITGKYDMQHTPIAQGSFAVNKGQIKHQKNNYVLDKINSEGSFYINPNKEKTDKIEFTTFTAELNGNAFTAKGAASNRKLPHIVGEIEGVFDLPSLAFFTSFEELIFTSGSAKIRTAIDWEIQNVEKLNLIKDITEGKTVLEAQLENASFTVAENPNNFNQINGDLSLKNDKVWFKNLTGNAGKSAFNLSGQISNIWPYILEKNEGLILKAEGVLESLYLEDWLIVKADENKTFSIFPDKSSIQIAANINKFYFKDFQAEKLQGNLLIDSRGWRFERFKLKAFDGEAAGNVVFKPSNNKQYQFLLSANVLNANIKEILNQTNNLSQDFIHAENLEGLLSGKTQISCQLNENFEIQSNSLQAISELSIDNGRLLNYEPMQEIANYFSSNAILKKMFKADEMSKALNDISFSKLNNIIEISNETVTIPAMEIKSSYLNLNLMGEHKFSNEIDYHLAFNLNEFMLREKGNKETEFGSIESNETGGKRVFLKLEGTTDNFNVTLNKKAQKSALKENFKQAKSEINENLKNEFNPELKNEEADFNFEEKEESEPKSSPLKRKPKKSSTDKETDFDIEFDEI